MARDWHLILDRRDDPFEGSCGAIQPPLLGQFGFLEYLKVDPNAADSDVTPEYCAKHNWLVGSPDTVAEKLAAMYDEVNGFGKLLGVTQLRELGELETPILLTCTLCIWQAGEALAQYMLAKPENANVRSINPVVRSDRTR